MRTVYDELFGFRHEFEQMFDRILRPWGARARLPAFEKGFGFVPAVEAYVDKEAKRYVCRMTAPGVEPKNFQVNVQGNLLTIRGERKFTLTTKGVELREQEFEYGAFERTVTLPEGVLVKKMTAEYVNGVLEITAALAATAEPRKVEVKIAKPIDKQIAA